MESANHRKFMIYNEADTLVFIIGIRRYSPPSSNCLIFSGSRSGLKPPRPSGRLLNSTVVGVWNEVE
jgi:hypothetical protein